MPQTKAGLPICSQDIDFSKETSKDKVTGNKLVVFALLDTAVNPTKYLLFSQKIALLTCDLTVEAEQRSSTDNNNVCG